MAGSDTIDVLDRKLLHALQTDGRARFSRIAAVLGVSDQTVARRYASLRAHHGVRVLGQVDETRVGRTRWILRLSCTPDAAAGFAAALARRADTRYVGLTSGGTEVLCVMAARTPAARDTLLLDKLQHTPRVSAVDAHCVLHTFYGGPSGWFSKSAALTPEQVDALAPPPLDPPDDPVSLDDVDERLIDLLGRDGRAPVSALAVAAEQSESSVRRRLDRLRRTGAAYYDLDVGTELTGQYLRVGLWLAVAPGDLAAVGAALAGHKEIVFAAATTGAPNLVAVALCRDAAHLYRYLTVTLGPLPVRAVETAPILREVKHLATRR